MCRTGFVGADLVLKYAPESLLVEHVKAELRARVRQELDDVLEALSVGGS